MKLGRQLKVIFDRTLDSFAIMAIMCITIIMFIVALEVVMRYFLNRPQTWVIEYAENFLVWFTFLGAAWILREEGHVKVDLLVNRLDPRSKALVDTITSGLGAIICFIIFWYSAQIVWSDFQTGAILERALRLPLGPLEMIVPIGTFLLFIQFIRRGYGYLRSWRALPVREQGS